MCDTNTLTAVVGPGDGVLGFCASCKPEYFDPHTPIAARQSLA